MRAHVNVQYYAPFRKYVAPIVNEIDAIVATALDTPNHTEPGKLTAKDVSVIAQAHDMRNENLLVKDMPDILIEITANGSDGRIRNQSDRQAEIERRIGELDFDLSGEWQRIEIVVRLILAPITCGSVILNEKGEK